MDLALLQATVNTMKYQLEEAISSGSYGGKSYLNGLEAKEALIRSQSLILNLHEAGKISIDASLQTNGLRFDIFPEIGHRGPEIAICGFIKAKKQDIVFVPSNIHIKPERIDSGPLMGKIDPVGKDASEKLIVVGVRSQLSSIEKNFDTLMERSFAETLNLRLRLPSLVMGEIYLIPIFEYNEKAMESNEIAYKRKPINVEKFISTFLSISKRNAFPIEDDLYKYERTALILIDFRQTPPHIFLNTAELKEANVVRRDFTGNYDLLSPVNFASDLVNIYKERHLNQ